MGHCTGLAHERGHLVRVHFVVVDADAIAQKAVEVAAQLLDARGVDDVLDNTKAVAHELRNVSVGQETGGTHQFSFSKF